MTSIAGDLFDSVTQSASDAGSFFEGWGKSIMNMFGSGDSSGDGSSFSLGGGTGQSSSGSKTTPGQNALNAFSPYSGSGAMLKEGLLSPDINNKVKATKPQAVQSVDPREMELRWMTMLSGYSDIKREVSGFYAGGGNQ